jgi:PAS domain S-box-containing protein
MTSSSIRTADGAHDKTRCAAEFDGFLADLGIGIFQTSIGGRVIRANEACARLFGFDTPDALAAAVQDIGHQTYVDPTRRTLQIARLLVEGRISGFVAQMRRRDGSTFWASETLRLVPDPETGERCLLGSVTDISAVVDQREALAAAERDYRSIFENATVGIYRSAPDGRQLRANPALWRLNGYSSEAEMRSDIADIGRGWYVDQARRDEFKALMERDDRVVNFESEIHRYRTRERIWIRENAWAVRDAAGTILFYEGLVEDITAERDAAELRRAREAVERELHAGLERSESRFRDFAETTADWFWEQDAELRFTYVSPSNEGISGITAADHIGIRRTETRKLGVSEAQWQAHLDTLARREPFKDFRFQRDDPQGRRRHLAISGKPMFGVDGAFIGYRGVGKDETDLVEAQRALEAALATARAATEQEQRFATAIAHEFRTPLTIIDGAAQRLLRQVDDPRPEDMRTRLGKIRAAVRSMESLIDTMLDSARAGSGRLVMDRTRQDLVAFVEAQIRRFDPAVTGREIVLARAVASAPVSADARMLEHIVANLLSNAIKYSGDSRRVEVAIALDGDGVALSVRDHGIGIPADELPQLFTRFFRASTAKGVPGTGIGLNLVRELVQRHDGRITVESTVGAGTRFTVVLPLDRDAKPG